MFNFTYFQLTQSGLTVLATKRPWTVLAPLATSFSAQRLKERPVVMTSSIKITFLPSNSELLNPNGAVGSETLPVDIVLSVIDVVDCIQAYFNIQVTSQLLCKCLIFAASTA